MLPVDEKRGQCVAITKKGARCKLLIVPNSKFCHVHVQTTNREKNKSKATVEASKKEHSNKKEKLKANYQDNDQMPGNIYVYTYAHMMHSTPIKTSYLHLAAPTGNNWIDFKRVTPFDTSEKILLKVGVTRKRPEVRVNEWRKQCGHSDFILIYPGCLAPNYKSNSADAEKSVNSLIRLLKKLTIKNGHNIERNQLQITVSSTGKKYSNLNQEKTCFVSRYPYRTEQEIHKLLRDRYGTGKMYCESCGRHRTDSTQKEAKAIGVHIEWFLIPRNEMHIVWEIIESQCK